MLSVRSQFPVLKDCEREQAAFEGVIAAPEQPARRSFGSKLRRTLTTELRPTNGMVRDNRGLNG